MDTMAKRFTDSDKWQDPWFSDLPNKYKLFYLYLLDTCDHAGIWKVNFKIARFMIGEDLEPSEVKRVLNDRIIYLSDEYWFVKKFIQFQYGGIKSDNVGKSVTKLLVKHGLEHILEDLTKHTGLGADKPLPRGYAGTKDKDKAKAKDKAKDIVKDNKSENSKNSIDDIPELQSMPREALTQKQYKALNDYMENLARRTGSMIDFTQPEIDTYINQVGSELWQKTSGNSKTKISEHNIRHDMQRRKTAGWLKVAETDNTFDAGAFN